MKSQIPCWNKLLFIRCCLRIENLLFLMVLYRGLVARVLFSIITIFTIIIITITIIMSLDISK